MQFIFQHRKKVGHAVDKPICSPFLDSGMSLVGCCLSVIEAVEEGAQVNTGTQVQTISSRGGAFQGGFIVELASDVTNIVTNCLPHCIVIGNGWWSVLLATISCPAGRAGVSCCVLRMGLLGALESFPREL